MAKRTKLTNNSDETDISQLLSGDSIFQIPYFQRPYKWKKERLSGLQTDILNIIDGVSDNHFLGAIIIHGRRANPSEPTIYEVIDGQQRITTLFLYIFAAIKTLCNEGEIDEAVALFQKYVALGRKPSGISNLKLQPCKEDRKQLNLVIDDLQKNVGFRDKLGSFTPQRLPSTGNDRGPLRNNFRTAYQFLIEQHKQGGLDRVRAIYQSILEMISVVQIDVWDPTNGPKIFDSLNSRQEPMTIGDLVRNEIFSKVSSEHVDNIELVDETHWQPFYRKFQNEGKSLFDQYFFPFGLIFDPNLSKSEVYGNLRDRWIKISDPADIVDELSRYQDAFIDITCRSNNQKHSKNIQDSFHRLYDAGSPTSTYTYLMQLSQACKDGGVSEENTFAINSAIECFLVRRAVCGIEPTGLHAVFKRLWVDCGGEHNVGRVTKEIKKHRTVSWPSDEDFANAIQTRGMYGTNIANFFIREYDKGLGGDAPLEINWIEHIVPQQLSEEWKSIFSDEEHAKYVHTVGNLIPLSSRMNQELGQKSFEEKSKKYSKDSMFKSARQLADGFENWTPESCRQRGVEISQWALSRWSLPAV